MTTAPPTITPAIRAKAAENLRKAKVQLVLHQPFFASIVLKRNICIEDHTQTAYMTAGGRIGVGTAFFAGMTVPECVFLLAHEAMHYAMLHHLRVGARKPRAANEAMDKVINDILIHSGLTPPEDGSFQDGAREYAWEQLYQEPIDDGSGSGQGPYQAGTGLDDLSGEGIGDVTPEQIEQIKQELIQARQASKAQGKLPAGMEALIDSIVNPPTPWHQLLERYMLNQIKAGTSWRRPNKRFINHDLYLPSIGRENAMGTVVIQIDESGSINDSMLRHFSGHTNKIIELCNPEKVIVLHTDTAVGKDEEFTADDYPIAFKSYCGGGTDMTAGFRWVAEHGIEPDVMITLTDGYSPWITAPLGYPNVVLCTTKEVLPYCEVIFYEVTD